MPQTVKNIENAKFGTYAELATIICGECGGTYAVSERYRKQKAEEGGSWNCPYCRTSWGYVTSALERVQKELARAEAKAQRMSDEAETAEARRRSQKAATTRLKKRAAAGLCPCCNRHFTNLHRHMKTQHPKYAKAT